MGMGATLTGLVCKYKPLSIAGMTGIALSFSMLFIHGSGVYLVFAAIFYSDDDCPWTYYE